MQPAVAIIPARMGSTRFPGKVLASDTGRPLIWHVHEAARKAAVVGRVVVATDDDRVASVVRSFGIEAVLTGDHPNGTSRLAEAAERLGLTSESVVVNVQGDEPEIEPGAIDAAVEALERTGADVGTVGSPFAHGEDPANPNIVKVVASRSGLALYFSRSLIPFNRDGIQVPEASPLKHIGLYTYRVGFLRRYAALAPTPLEQAEKLEQLRVLEHDLRIAVAIHPCHHHGIDTPDQYLAFVRRWWSANNT
jgi:3-deoxy-manno-octulosonate cytidylyltransferase (CMP-KDO synthetase)